MNVIKFIGETPHVIPLVVLLAVTAAQIVRTIKHS